MATSSHAAAAATWMVAAGREIYRFLFGQLLAPALVLVCIAPATVGCFQEKQLRNIPLSSIINLLVIMGYFVTRYSLSGCVRYLNFYLVSLYKYYMNRLYSSRWDYPRQPTYKNPYEYAIAWAGEPLLLKEQQAMPSRHCYRCRSTWCSCCSGKRNL